MNSLFALLALLVGCAAFEDCLFFEDCEPYRPAGLDCGLAHSGLDHWGGACGDRYDPAHKYIENEAVTTGRAGVVCPPGFERVTINDDAGDYSVWATCRAVGNLRSSSGELRDVPQGLTCGLGTSVLGEGDCEGYRPALGECPPGMRFSWVADRVVDRTDAACKPDEEGAFDAVSWGRQVRILPFCVVDDGCVEGACPSRVTPASMRGMLCGLHTREYVQYFGSDGTPETRKAPLPFPEYTEPEDLAIFDVGRAITDWIVPCSDDLDDLNVLLDVIEAHRDEAPACLGRSLVGQPKGEECPDGLTLVCTGDYMANPGALAFGPLINSLCWCDAPEQQQLLDGSELTTTGSIDDTH